MSENGQQLVTNQEDIQVLEGLKSAKAKYVDKDYRGAIQSADDLLPICCNKRLLSEIHLFLAKCHKGVEDIKSAITSCNSAIAQYSRWKDPFLYRSACFQALHTSYLETDGDSEQNIDLDRKQADIIVDPNYIPKTDNSEESSPKPEKKKDKNPPKQIYVTQIDEALRLAKDGGKVFVEKGIYDVTAASSSSSASSASFFVFGKNISLIGASTRDCVLQYRRKRPDESADKRDDKSSEKDADRDTKLETFLICASNGVVPTLIKRLTFRNENSDSIKTKFLGVAGGTVQLEDCLFDGVDNSEVDAVYTNSKICGNFASNYPPPHVLVRFCVFDHCQSFGAFTALHSCGTIRCSYFTGCGRTAVAAMDAAKVTVEDCEFAQTDISETTISSTSSDITVSGSYIHGVQVPQLTTPSSCHAIGITLKSVAKIHNNYIYKTGSGVSCLESDLVCSRNMFYNCSRRYLSHREVNTTLGLYSGISVKSKSKVQLFENLTKHCDVGIYIGKGAMPAVKDNVIDSSFFTGLFADTNSRPNIVTNTLNGGASDVTGQAGKGLGILFIFESGGIVGKNQLEDFEVSPIMVFAKCNPLLKDNSFVNVKMDEVKQEVMEKNLLHQFQAHMFPTEEFFYLVDGEEKEAALQQIIFKGLANAKTD